MALVGDEDAVGWCANGSWCATGEAPEGEAQAAPPGAAEAAGSGADGRLGGGVAGAAELSALLKLGKHMTAAQTARAAELMQMGIIVTAAMQQGYTPPAPPSLTMPPSPPRAALAAQAAPPEPTPAEAAGTEDLPARAPSPGAAAAQADPSSLLFDAFVGEALEPPFEAAPLDPSNVFVLSPRLEVSSVEVMGLLLRLLPSLSVDLQTRACADLVRLLSLRPANAAAVVSSVSWQPTLFALIAGHIASSPAIDSEASDEAPDDEAPDEAPEGAEGGAAAPAISAGSGPSDDFAGLSDDSALRSDPSGRSSKRVVRLADLQTRERAAAQRSPNRTRDALELAAAYGGHVDEAMKSRSDTVYEYQRWMPVRGWGTVLLPTDPGRWSCGEGGDAAWGGSLAELAPPLPGGWEVSAPWASGGEQGWTYSTSATFRAAVWAPTSGGTRTVRRRAWNRTIKLLAAGPLERARGAPDGGADEGGGADEEGGGSSGSGDLGPEKVSAEGSGEDSGEDSSPATSPLCLLATRAYVKLLAHCICSEADTAGALELLLALEKQSGKGEAVVLLVLSHLLADLHHELLARAATAATPPGGCSWVDGVRGTALWDNLKELLRVVSVLTSNGAAAVAGIPGAKRAVLISRRSGEVGVSQCRPRMRTALSLWHAHRCPHDASFGTRAFASCLQAKKSMTREELTKCHYKCDDSRHRNICFLKTDNCPQCHHSLTAHDLVARPDIFRSLRRFVFFSPLSPARQRPLAPNALPRGTTRELDDTLTSSEDPAAPERRGGSRPQALLEAEFPGLPESGLGGLDTGDGLVMFTTTTGEETVPGAPLKWSAVRPMPPLAAGATGVERHLLVAVQAAHLTDLILFPADSDKLPGLDAAPADQGGATKHMHYS